MLLLIETWLAACFWFSDCTICWMVQPVSERRCSIQVSGRVRDGPWPCRRRVSSATNAAIHRRVGARHVGDDHDQVFRIPLGGLDQLVGPGVGAVAADAVSGDARRDAAQVFDQREAQHDRQRPQLAEGQRGDGLVGGDKAGEALGIDPAVAVRDDFQRDVVDAGKTGGRAGRQARQLAAVALWADAAWRCESALR